MGFALASEVEIGSEDVWVALTGGLLGSHLGIAYTGIDGSPVLLHLAFHKKLMVEDFPPDGCWLVTKVQLSVLLSSQLVALLHGIAAKHSYTALEARGASHEAGVDYGINFYAGEKAINLEGDYAPGEGCDGYTCSSFVAAIFSVFRASLVDINNWRAEPKNIVWGEAVVCLLRALGASAEHVALVESNNVGLRLRPEEVAAAAEFQQDERPVSQENLKARADSLAKELIAKCGPPPAPPPGHRLGHCIAAFNDGMAKFSAL